MKKYLFLCLSCLLFCSNALADDHQASISEFKKSDQTKPFFDNAYAYAVFPSIGKGGIGIGGAFGKGKVYRAGEYVGNVSMGQMTVGFQLGGQAFSQIVFLQDKRAYDEFTGGSFEFGAQASAVALTAGVSAQAGTTGTGAGAGDKQSKAKYINGYAVFTLAKGGLMYEATIGGQKFSYKPK